MPKVPPPKKLIISRYWVHAGLVIAGIVAVAIIGSGAWGIISHRVWPF